MCGIAGFFSQRGAQGGAAADTLARMAESLRHRGPDHSAVWTCEDRKIGLAHTRLAVLDLSPAGSQPMRSASGRYVVVYNGEIYNHQQIREQLADAGRVQNWKGHSDTETLLAAIEAWGLKEALSRSQGMFAVALWDELERSLTLARDRLGEKPLYYGREYPGGPFLFGSELKALAQHPQFRGEIDRDALTLLLRYCYIPAPFSIYRGIRKLLPGTILTLESVGAEPNIEHYWSAAKIAEDGKANPLDCGASEAIDSLERLLRSAIGQQMVADVSLGAFLSGGVDSSVVVALMQGVSARPVKTFTIGFHEQGYNEAEHAKAVARHLGTDHTELYVTPEEARAVIPELPAIYDEPFADSSQIPTHLVSTLARSEVTVSLSGDGGDELFGGYNRYMLTDGLWKRMSAIPAPMRGAAARLMTLVGPEAWNRIGHLGSGVLPKALRFDRLGDKIHKGAPLLGSRSAEELYGGMISLWRKPENVVRGATEPVSQATGAAPELRGLPSVERMMALDMLGYLPDDILVKVDRASMAVSLESRVPLLDHRVVELAWKLPYRFKVRDGQSKWILRQLLYRHVPKKLIERPKMGFGVPIDSWLRGPLRDWAEELLDERRLYEQGFFHPDPIREVWNAHLSGRANEQYRLWSVLMFQSWLRSREVASLAGAQEAVAASAGS